MAKYTVSAKRRQALKKLNRAKNAGGHVACSQASPTNEAIELESGLSADLQTVASQLNNPALSPIQRQALARQVGQTQGNGYLQRLVDYNETVTDGRFTDPEQAAGLLPFIEDGWDGMQIARNLSQLSPGTDPDDNVRCAQTSFLAALVLQGPTALHGMLENYLGRYRHGLRQLTTPERIKRWYRRAIRHLRPLLAKIEDQSLSYEDLSTILSEMYDVYGDPSGTTFLDPALNMVRREGYDVTEMSMEGITQEEAAAEAQNLEPGEFLWCHVEASKGGTGEGNHWIHIGRDPNEGGLYLYDPWPMSGDQLVQCNESLSEIEHYFQNPLEDESEAEDEAEDDIEFFELRTFNIYGKLAPQSEEDGEAA